MDWVFFSSLAWDDQGGAHRPTRLARALAAQGYRVLFVQVLPCPASSGDPNIQLASLEMLGLSETEIGRAWYGIENPPPDRLSANLERLLDGFERSTARAAVWNVPFAPLVALLPVLARRGYRTVYDCIDDFGAALEIGYYFVNPAAERFLAERCDLVLGLSKPIVDKLRHALTRARVELVADGADLNFRARQPIPSDLVRGDLTLGFWGTIADYAVDADALAFVARARPGWSINLIGAVDPEPARPPVARALAGLGNVHLLGPRPHDTLMNYLAGLDVCLIPFPDNAFSRGRDPIKLYEYLAGYKPVVTLHTPQLAGIPYVRVAESPAEFLEQIEQARRAPVDLQCVDEYLRANSWEARAGQLAELVSGLSPASPSAGATYSLDPFEREDDPADRTRAYIAHLERLAEERRAYSRSLEEQANAMRAYILKLEGTHPLILIKRAWERLRARR